MKEFDMLEESLNKKAPEDSRSLKDLMREKRESAEKVIESQQAKP